MHLQKEIQVAKKINQLDRQPHIPVNKSLFLDFPYPLTVRYSHPLFRSRSGRGVGYKRNIAIVRPHARERC